MTSKIIISLLLTVLFFACQSETTAPQDQVTSNDANLIQAIVSAPDKQVIDAEQLPPISKYILDENYSDSYVDEVKFSPKLGYEVTTRKEWGTHIDDPAQLYFAIDGRELHEVKNNMEGRDHDGADHERDKCFTLVYPVTFSMPDGSTITGEDGKAICTAIREWYEANPDVTERPKLEFPVDVILADGTTMTINNADELDALKNNCPQWDDDDDGEHDGERDRDHAPCFKLVLPVTYIMPDNSEITVADSTDWAEIKIWYENNPDATERPQLKFPVDVVLKDGTVMTIYSADELRALKEDCKDHEGEDKDDHEGDFEACFRLVYPLTFIMPDNSTITAGDKEEAAMAIRDWYAANPDATERPVLQYPVDIIYKDGTTLTINSVDELRNAFAACGDKDGHHEDWDDDHDDGDGHHD